MIPGREEGGKRGSVSKGAKRRSSTIHGAKVMVDGGESSLAGGLSGEGGKSVEELERELRREIEEEEAGDEGGRHIRYVGQINCWGLCNAKPLSGIHI